MVDREDIAIAVRQCTKAISDFSVGEVESGLDRLEILICYLKYKGDDVNETEINT